MKIGSLGEKSGWQALSIGLIDVGAVLVFPFGAEDIASPTLVDEAVGLVLIGAGMALYEMTEPKKGSSSASPGRESAVEFAAAESSMGFGFGFVASDLEEMVEDAIPYLL